MTTQTKLNIAVFTSSIVMMLSVFSKPLHIPEAIQWALMIGLFIPLGLIFYFIRRLKQEKAMGPGITIEAPETTIRKRTRNRLILMMGGVCVLGLCAPFWLPLTGTTLGPRGD